MRSAQNAMRIKRALQAEDLPYEKLRYVLNRAPKFTDLAGKSRVKRLADSLSISIDVLLPDGGRQVMNGSDHGQPLGLSAPKNPLRKEISKLAESLLELGQSDPKAA
jgi:pilus assembly protein CpaE